MVLNIALPFVQHGRCPDLVLPYRNGKSGYIRTFLKENPNPRLFQRRWRMINIDPHTRIIDLTVGQLMELLESAKDIPQQAIQEVKEHRKVYGIAGIAQIFNCSMTTANRIKRSGRIDRAITQHGRIIVVDVELALQL